MNRKIQKAIKAGAKEMKRKIISNKKAAKLVAKEAKRLASEKKKVEREATKKIAAASRFLKRQQVLANKFAKLEKKRAAAKAKAERDTARTNKEHLKELRKQERLIAAENNAVKNANKKVYKPRRRRGSIIADKAAKEARRRIRTYKKSMKVVSTTTRSRRRTKVEIQVDLMTKEIQRQDIWKAKFMEKYGLKTMNYRQIVKAAKSSI